VQRANNGGDNGVASLTQELQHRLELKDEEAKKYREQYENTARQLQVPTCSHRNKF
jgi:molybdenum-dependent DNA-binding transcriptional regulator ModE